MKPIVVHGVRLFMGGLLLLLAGCQGVGKGGLLGDLGLTQDSSSPVANVERALLCLGQNGGQTKHSFFAVRRTLERELARDNTVPPDWSELICIALGDTATPIQIGEALDVLSVIADRQQPPYLPLDGLRWILEQRKALIEDSAVALQDLATQLANERNTRTEERSETQKLLGGERQKVLDLREQVDKLEKQVRELKEVELKLQPQTPDIR